MTDDIEIVRLRAVVEISVAVGDLTDNRSDATELLLTDLETALGASTWWDPTDDARLVVHDVPTFGQRIPTLFGGVVIPEHVDIRRYEGDIMHIVIDGVPFPYAIARDSVTAVPTAGRAPDTISLDLIADRVTITDEPKGPTS